MSARLFAYGIALAVFLLDQITKLAIRSHVPTWDTIRVIPGFFNIMHTENPGAAFSLFSDAHSAWRTFLLVAVSAGALVVVASLLWRPTERVRDYRSMRLGLALVLGGALGNLYDRIVHGAVTDFVELYMHSFRWPAFNVADSAITIGALLILMTLLRSRHAPEVT